MYSCAVVFRKYKIYLYLYVRVCICVSVCEVSASAHGGQKRTSDPLEMELQANVSHPKWVLGKERWYLEEQQEFFPAEMSS